MNSDDKEPTNIIVFFLHSDIYTIYSHRTRAY